MAALFAAGGAGSGTHATVLQYPFTRGSAVMLVSYLPLLFSALVFSSK